MVASSRCGACPSLSSLVLRALRTSLTSLRGGRRGRPCGRRAGGRRPGRRGGGRRRGGCGLLLHLQLSLLALCGTKELVDVVARAFQRLRAAHRLERLELLNGPNELIVLVRRARHGR